MFFRQMMAVVAASAGLLLSSCQPGQSQGRAVRFGPTPVYRLAKGAQEVVPDKATTQFYEQRFNFHPRFNQPLHRLVRGNGPDVYLGLVVPPGPTDLAVLIRPDSVWQAVANRTEPQGQLAMFRNPRRGEYNVRYAGKAVKTGNIHVINLLTTDSTLARSYYSADKLFKGNLLL